MKYLFVAAPVQGTEPWHVWIRNDEGHVADMGSMLLSELHSCARELLESRNTVEPVLLVPGEQVFSCNLPMTSKQFKEASSGIPYLIEDMVSEDVEQLHIIHGPRNDSEGVPVLAVGRDRMSSWLEALAAAGISPAFAIPDFLVLPMPQTGSWLTLKDDARILIRSGLNSGMTIDAATLDLVTSSMTQRAGSSTSVVSHPANGLSDVLEGFDTTALGKSLLNFRQGDFRSTAESKGSFARWKWPAVALLAAFVAQLVVEWGHYAYYSRKSAAIELQASEMYRQIFPEERRIVNLRRQLQAHVSEASSGNNKAEGFGDLLSRVSSAARQAGNLNVVRISTDVEGKVLLDIQSDASAIEKLEQPLRQNGLEISSVEPVDKGVRLALQRGK